MQLELNEQERQELLELVRNAYADLNPEIAHSMDTNYRETLRQRRALYEGLLKRLGGDSQSTK